LIVRSRENLVEHKKTFAHEHAPIRETLEAVKVLKPGILIGVSGQPATFDQPIVEAMAALNPRPIIFALSNPTSMAECTAEQAYAWSEGRAIFASGSPFDPVSMYGKKFVPGQGNNAYIFPGVGLGAVVAQTAEVTDEMFFVAAKVLAEQVSEEDLNLGRVYPSLSKIRQVSELIAVAVAEVAYAEDLARVPRPENLAAAVREAMFDPEYI
jgi:malate dehydrogenase (oxaloacetate-decarboxylating)(NADP+)